MISQASHYALQTFVASALFAALPGCEKGPIQFGPSNGENMLEIEVIPIGSSTTFDIPVSNHSNQPVNITKVEGDCICTSAIVDPSLIAAKSNGVLSITLKPRESDDGSTLQSTVAVGYLQCKQKAGTKGYGGSSKIAVPSNESCTTDYGGVGCTISYGDCNSGIYIKADTICLEPPPPAA